MQILMVLLFAFGAWALTPITDEFFKMFLAPDALNFVKTMTTPSALSCASICNRYADDNFDGCTGFRFNDTDKLCQIGLFDSSSQNGFDGYPLLPPGDVPTMIYRNFSSKKTFFRTKTAATFLESINFCKAAGPQYQLAEPRSQELLDEIFDLLSGIRIGLHRHDDGIWRWVSDGTPANVDLGSSGHPCAVANVSVQGALQASYCSRGHFICQLIP